MPASEHPRDLVRFGDFELDPATGELYHSGSVNRLQPQPLKVLLALLRNPGELVSRDDLKREVMPDTPFGDSDHAINLAVTKLRSALQDSSDKPAYIDTLPRRGYRFIASVSKPIAAGEQDGISGRPGIPRRSALIWLVISVLVLIGILATVLAQRRGHNTTRERCTVVIASFTNNTHLTTLDRTLRDTVAAVLQRSPSLSLISQDRISQVLPLMMKPKDTVLTPDIAREVCRRTAGALVIDGAISRLGERYLVELEAANCGTGDILLHEQVIADTQEQISDKLSRLARDVGDDLARKMPSVKDRAPPVELVTTDSYEALQAYTLGHELMRVGRDESAAIPVFEHAILLSHEFAMAYLQLGMVYNSMRQATRAEEAIQTAYAMSRHVSDPERIHIEAAYERIVTGNLESARKKYNLLTQIYPSDTAALLGLGETHVTLGDCEKGAVAFERALAMSSRNATVYTNMVSAELCRNHLDRAKSLAQEASKLGIDTPRTHISLYLVGMLQNDLESTRRESEYLSTLPEWRATILCLEAKTAARHREFGKARELVRKASDTALLQDQVDIAANCHADAAEWEALAGNTPEAKQQAHTALSLARSREVRAKTGLSLAQVGQFNEAEHQALMLERSYPTDTKVLSTYVPTIRRVITLTKVAPVKTTTHPGP